MDWKIMRKQHNVTIDFLRFLFSVIVVLHHSRYVLGDDNCYFLGGSLAVEFFFFVCNTRHKKHIGLVVSLNFNFIFIP